MTGDGAQEIRREYGGGQARFEFPIRSLGWGKLVGLFFVGFGLLFMWIFNRG
jgi:hypothetical protein